MAERDGRVNVRARGHATEAAGYTPSMAVKTRMTLDEFLALPETEPASEFAHGEVTRKPMPNYLHSLLQAALVVVFSEYFKRARVDGVVLPELRHANRDEERAFLPDIAVRVGAKAHPDWESARGTLDDMPDIAIEILSPDDRPGRVADKLAFYLRMGVPLVWLVDPEERRVDVYRPDEPSTSYGPPAALDANPVLRDFRLDLREFFAPIDRLRGTAG